MNVDQMKGVVAIDEEGSVSRAARRLFISQSTLSNSMASLEREVGFRIFERSNQGMRATGQGRRLISYARSILHFSECILALSDSGSQTCRFRLVSSREKRLNRAFVKFCLAHKDDTVLEISFLPAVNDHIAEMIYRDLADYGIACIKKTKLKGYEAFCSSHNLVIKELGSITLEVICAADHPLMFEEDLLHALPAYPLIVPSDRADMTPSEEVLRSFGAPQGSEQRVIRVADRDTRLDLLSHGVGYMIGILDRSAAENWGLAARKLDVQYGVYSLVREDRKNDPCVLEFEKILMEESPLPRKGKRPVREEGDR